MIPNYLCLSILVVLLQIILMMLSFKLASSRKFYRLFDAQDVIAIVFCSTHKSLTLGKIIRYIYGVLLVIWKNILCNKILEYISIGGIARGKGQLLCKVILTP